VFFLAEGLLLMFEKLKKQKGSVTPAKAGVYIALKKHGFPLSRE